ncbi:uncharacterized CRM domain-containing protein At3g25440, chloroplastic isoform X1 [Amborella trichopoda]|uniref:CRM domain-containing protein n=2 Tax=Amborella trichopoda TaxID=13333 RepID=W1PU60_AMBTC|nr:uncharacterized CRM domain-containing protein At3g25440, chloroplastic isoform X1 [Amborella trichopoda]ERN13572.1 hypothetical protein AMTR_s00049p00011400 [Amborella trichopoda]|eukprot:XP_020527760.1 uncharacterized CRM domain-containing protein At3g25440, chloroplastic isoform X1 [Amborella trichopoda]
MGKLSTLINYVRVFSSSMNRLSFQQHVPYENSLCNGFCKVSGPKPMFGFCREMGSQRSGVICPFHMRNKQLRFMSQEALEPQKLTTDDVHLGDGAQEKPKRKKLKGKRAVIKWLKFFRWQKKKEYERMTAEEKILYKLRKARRKEARLAEAWKKIEPKEDSGEPTHDPEILTPEEHFYYLKMGHKCKNYVPIGRRGIFQGVILNMHLHWKKHQTLKVIVKTFTPEEVQELASELARLSGGIVLDIHEGNTIIMYRGKNYSQPPTEIMSPRVTLSRKKALDKSKFRDGLRAVRIFIPRLERELEVLQAQMKKEHEQRLVAQEENPTIELQQSVESEASNSIKTFNTSKEDSMPEFSDPSLESDSLSDIFESDTESCSEEGEKALYLDEIEGLPSDEGEESDDFEEHLRRISGDRKRMDWPENDNMPELDEVDKMFLRAGSLLKNKRS